jgi:hypothetical protein
MVVCLSKLPMAAGCALMRRSGLRVRRLWPPPRLPLGSGGHSTCRLVRHQVGCVTPMEVQEQGTPGCTLLLRARPQSSSQPESNWEPRRREWLHPHRQRPPAGALLHYSLSCLLVQDAQTPRLSQLPPWHGSAAGLCRRSSPPHRHSNAAKPAALLPFPQRKAGYSKSGSNRRQACLGHRGTGPQHH